MSENKNLYKIKVQHIAPKDEHTSIECFLLAENDEAVYHWLDEEKECGTWTYRNDEDGLLNIYNEEYEVIGTETYKEKMIRIKGELLDDDQDWSDAYYGITFYGWELSDETPTPILIESLKKMKVLFEVN